MTTKEPRQIYEEEGRNIPVDYLPAHNDIWHTPGFHHGKNGFRIFLDTAAMGRSRKMDTMSMRLARS